MCACLVKAFLGASINARLKELSASAVTIVTSDKPAVTRVAGYGSKVTPLGRITRPWSSPVTSRTRPRSSSRTL